MLCVIVSVFGATLFKNISLHTSGTRYRSFSTLFQQFDQNYGSIKLPLKMAKTCGGIMLTSFTLTLTCFTWSYRSVLRPASHNSLHSVRLSVALTSTFLPVSITHSLVQSLWPLACAITLTTHLWNHFVG